VAGFAVFCTPLALGAAFFWLAFLVEVALVAVLLAPCVAAVAFVVVAAASVAFVIVVVPFLRVLRAPRFIDQAAPNLKADS
jgi:hypothetical protein